MSTSQEPLKYLWAAYFDDGAIIEQPADDRYSKHDDNAEHNPSSFRDILDHEKKAKLIYFDINDQVFAYGVDLPSGRFGINGTWFSMELGDEKLTDRKLVYYREMKKDAHLHSDGTVTEDDAIVQSYCFGYEGKNSKGEKITKVIRVE